MSFRKRAAQAILDDLDIDLASIGVSVSKSIKKLSWSIEPIETNIEDAHVNLRRARNHVNSVCSQAESEKIKNIEQFSIKSKRQQDFAAMSSFLPKIEKCINNIKSLQDQATALIKIPSDRLTEPEKNFWNMKMPDGAVGRGFARLKQIYLELSNLVKEVKELEEGFYLSVSNEDTGHTLYDMLSDAKDEIENALWAAGEKDPQLPTEKENVEYMEGVQTDYYNLVDDAIAWWESVKTDPIKKNPANKYFATPEWQTIKSLRTAVDSGQFEASDLNFAVTAARSKMITFK